MLNFDIVAHPNFLRMELKWGMVRPRLILFPSDEIPGRETVYHHHFIVLRFRHGISFVLDFAGYQFGFSKVLYTLQEFEAEVLDNLVPPRADRIWGYIAGTFSEATSSDRDVVQQRAFQLMDLAWELNDW